LTGRINSTQLRAIRRAIWHRTKGPL